MVGANVIALTRLVVVNAVVTSAGTRFASAAHRPLLEVESVHGVTKPARGRRLNCCATAAGWRWHIGRIFKALFFVKLLLLSPTSLPTVAPISHEIVEQPSLQIETRANADRKIVEVHAVTLLVRQKQAEMTRDGEQKVVVEWRKLGQDVAKPLWGGLAHHVEVRVLLLQLDSKGMLELLRENFAWKLAQPCLEHAANCVWVVKLALGEKVDIKF